MRVGFGRTQFSPAGGVGTFSFVNLENPSGSGVLARVIRCLGDVTPGGAADGMQLRVGVTLLGGGQKGFPLDSRQGWTAGNSVCNVTAGNIAAPTGTFIGSEAIPASGSTRELGEFSRGIIVAPGAGITVLRATAVLPMNGSWEWTEEAL